jgi:hypothetical protein
LDNELQEINMAQGIAWDKEKILKVLEPKFKKGMNRYKACIACAIDPSLLKKWEDKDPTLSKRIDSWIAEPNEMARDVVLEAIKKGKDSRLAMEWLEKKEKDEFSTRTESIVAEATLDEVLNGLENDKDLDSELAETQEPTVEDQPSI